MKQKIALVIGSTGLVGKSLTQQLLMDEKYQAVHVFVRREIVADEYQDPEHKLHSHLVNFDDISQWQTLLKGDELFCCIGTTLKQAGSQSAQRKVDLDIPTDIAQYANQNGVQKIALVSSAGANPKSASFYLRLKGQLEQNLQALDWQHITIVRPSFLAGKRSNPRFGEQLAINLYAVLQYIPIIKRYRPIQAEQVAKRMRERLNREHNTKLVIEELEQLF
ncbi:NAD(P)H-binding protein [Marinomonas sp. 5E14-1]|uniref:NAD(P)H-binding protein n=1 Tax=Marinomonas sp. 5E14-1 TaxID=3153922 RepID=UPI00326316EF